MDIQRSGYSLPIARVAKKWVLMAYAGVGHRHADQV